MACGKIKSRCHRVLVGAVTMSRPPAFTELIDESTHLERAGQIGAALQRAKAALEQARAEGDSEAIAAALNRVALTHFRLGHYEQARATPTRVIAQTLRVPEPQASLLPGILLGDDAGVPKSAGSVSHHWHVPYSGNKRL